MDAAITIWILASNPNGKIGIMYDGREGQGDCGLVVDNNDDVEVGMAAVRRWMNVRFLASVESWWEPVRGPVDSLHGVLDHMGHMEKIKKIWK